MPRGGARAGAGRPRADGEPNNAYSPEVSDAQLDFERERAEHERVKREQRQFKLDCEMGLYLPRVAVQQASATALAVLTQSLRSLTDVLERAANLTPQQAEIAERTIDQALSEVSVAFKAMSEG
jgi:Protein of unknown function (DUF1441)